MKIKKEHIRRMRKTKSYEKQEGAYMKLVKKIVGVALIFVLMVSMVGCNTTTNTKENKGYC